jgi:hypothetical protein
MRFRAHRVRYCPSRSVTTRATRTARRFEERFARLCLVFFGVGFFPAPGFVGAGEPVVIVTGPLAAV